jgi:hypothetical protein
MALLLAPSALLLGAARTPPGLRLFALGLLAGVSAVPKVLRSPSRPVFSDEFAHLRESVNLVEGWGLFESNALVRMASEFPGMHAAVAALAETLALPVWPVAQATVAVTHLLLVWAVFALVSQFASLRAAGVATLVYATNPSFLLFNMQVAYESFALPLALWVLVAVTAALRLPSGWARRGLWAAATVLAATVVVSHHLSTLGLAVSLLLVAGGVWRRDGLSAAAPVATLAAATVAGFAGWVASGQVALGGYLAPSVRVATSAVRRPFGGSQLPVVEQAAGLVLPGVLVTLAGWALWWLWRSKTLSRLTGPAAGLSLLTAGLFASMPLVLVASAAEGARRSWAWGYLGLAVLAAVALDAAADRPRTRWTPVRATGAVAAALLLMVGGVAVSLDERYRLPGPVQTGADARSFSLEAWQLAEVLAPQVRSGDRLLADRYVRGPLVVSAPLVAVSPSAAYPVWDPLLSEEPGPDMLWLMARTVDLVVVDVRMGDRRPPAGFWFNRGEPADSSLAPQALARLDCLGVRVASAGPYLVWRLTTSSPSAAEACR